MNNSNKANLNHDHIIDVACVFINLRLASFLLSLSSMCSKGVVSSLCCTSICPPWSALHLHHYRAHCRKALIEVTFTFTVQSGGVWAAHFNFLSAGRSLLIGVHRGCGPQSVDGSNDCISADVSEAEWLKAVQGLPFVLRLQLP